MTNEFIPLDFDKFNEEVEKAFFLAFKKAMDETIEAFVQFQSAHRPVGFNKGMEDLAKGFNEATMSLGELSKVNYFRFLFRHKSRWRMMNKTGQNSKQRRRDQVRLKGRRCKKH